MIAATDEGKVADIHGNIDENVIRGNTYLGGTISREELYSQGMKVLCDFFGIVNAEIFISLVKNDKCDYTEWRRDYYDKMAPDEYFSDVREFAKTHPYKGDPSTILKPQE